MRSTWDPDRTLPPLYQRPRGSASSEATSSSLDPVSPHGQLPRPPSLAALRTPAVPMRFSPDVQTRRNRSISEVTGTFNRSSPLREPPRLDDRRPNELIGAEHRLPPLSRLSSNIRRSNTISALTSPSSSQYAQFGPRHLPMHSQAGIPGASRAGHSPGRIFSRQFSDTGDVTANSSMTLPPLTPMSMSNTGSGLPMLLSPSSSSTSRLTSSVERERDTSLESSLAETNDGSSPRKQAKAHVASACLNCKKAHLACDVSRPCRRCVNLGKVDTCIDVRHKKRGRPRLRERELSLGQSVAVTGLPSGTANSAEAQALPGARRTPVQPPSMINRSNEPLMPRPRAVTRTEYQHYEGQNSIAPAHRAYMSHDDARTGVSSSYYAPTIASHAGRARSFSAVNPPTWSRPETFSGYADPEACKGAPQQANAVVSFILSTALHCVRCSEECQSVLGFEPRDLTDISFFDLVHPADEPRIERLWTSLIAPVGIRAQAIHHYRNTIMSLSPAGLMMPAAGTVFLQEDDVRLRNRDGSYQVFSIRLHLGAGLGADLFRDHTLELAYIVASVVRAAGSASTKAYDLGVGASGGGSGGDIERDSMHPDPNLLREARWHEGFDSRQFNSPGMPEYPAQSQHRSGHSGNRRNGGEVKLLTAPSAMVC